MDWTKDIGNWKDLGEAIANYNGEIGNVMAFSGYAEYTDTDGIRKLEIFLAYEPATDEDNRCIDCQLIPDRPTLDNPIYCTFCFQKVCQGCYRGHEKNHWKQPKTIAGEPIGPPF